MPEGRDRRVLDALFPTRSDQEAALFADLSAEPWRVLADLAARLQHWLGQAGVEALGTLAPDADFSGVARCSALYVGSGAVVEPTAVLVGGPIVLAAGAVVRAGAYIRGPAYIGAGAVVGHASEIKNSVLLAQARAPHFNFVGDSVLGHDCNLGAGTKLSNLRFDGRMVRLHWEGQSVDSGLRKLGALIGERAQTGCNAVLNPGTVLLPGTLVPPAIAVKGTLAPGRARPVVGPA